MTRTVGPVAHSSCAAAGARRSPPTGSSPSRSASRDSAPSAPPSSRRTRAARAARSAARRSRGRGGPRAESAIASRTRARIWNAKCGVAGPTRASMSSIVGSLIGRRSLTSSVGRMRRPSTVELMLSTTIGLWALNLTVSRYILTHGFQPLAYAHRPLRARRARLRVADARRRAVAPLLPPRPRARRRGGRVVYVNQIAFVYALETTSASVLGLILGATPIFAALAGLALRTESAPVALLGGGAALVPRRRARRARLGRRAPGDLGGVLLGVLTAATWAGYSMLVTPLMRRYSARGSRRRARRSRGSRSR